MRGEQRQPRNVVSRDQARELGHVEATCGLQGSGQHERRKAGMGAPRCTPRTSLRVRRVVWIPELLYVRTSGALIVQYVLSIGMFKVQTRPGTSLTRDAMLYCDRPRSSSPNATASLSDRGVAEAGAGSFSPRESCLTRSVLRSRSDDTMVKLLTVPATQARKRQRQKRWT